MAYEPTKLSKIQTLYENLKTNKAALQFNSIFIIRRFFMAAAVVYCKDNQVFQISNMIIISLIMIIYIIKVRPY